VECEPLPNAPHTDQYLTWPLKVLSCPWFGGSDIRLGYVLSRKGRVYDWYRYSDIIGTLNGTLSGLTSDGFSESSTVASSPLRLQLPFFTRSIRWGFLSLSERENPFTNFAPFLVRSCGRVHSSAMDSNGSVWTFLNWGRPFRLSSPRLSSSDSTPIQVECGWMFSSLLTKSGDVFVWWPFVGQMDTLIQNRMSAMDQEGNKQKAVEGVISCACWDLEMDPYLLPSLPPLSNISVGDEAFEETRIIQIAGFEDNLIALTNHGHVLIFDSLQDETTAPRGSWRYVRPLSSTF